MNKIANLFIVLFAVGIIDNYVQIFLFPVLVYWFFSLSKSSTRENLLVFILILTMLLVVSLRKVTTSIGNYVELFVYLLVLFSIRRVVRIKIDACWIVLILMLNIFYLLKFPLANIYMTNELHFRELGFPNYLRYILIGTIPAFFLSIIILRGKSLFNILVLLIFLILANKTTNLLLVSLFLILKNLNVRFFLTLTFSILLLFLFNFQLPGYMNDRLQVIFYLNFNSEELSRLPLLVNSWKTFVAYPLFGLGFFKGDFLDISQLLNWPIGHHSHLVDNLGRFGLIWLVVVIREYKLYWATSGVLALVFLIWSLGNNVITLGSSIVLLIMIQDESSSRRILS